jgi:uracil-DNA glycosylase family 4
MPAQNPRYAKPPGCLGCSLQTMGFGFALPVGPPSARLVFVGESLGYEEAIHGEPFIGSAGGVLSRILTRAGINRPDVRIANVVSCRPPNDYLAGAPWEEHAIAMCRQYLDPVLRAVPDNAVVIPLGGTALTAILNLRGVPGIAVKEWHGTVTRDPSNRYWVVPSFHPSFLQRGAMNLLQVATEDLKLADRVSQRGFVKSKAQLVVDPPPEWFDRWVDDHLRRVAADPDGVHLSLDTEFPEKAGGRDESEVLAWNAVSPITRVNGGNDDETGWTVPYTDVYRHALEKLLAGVARYRGWMWLWNKYADFDHLQQAGHTLDGIMGMDGMWLWHYLQSDTFRGLGFVAPIASDFGPWKHWAENKEYEGPYAAADGLQTWRTCMWLLKSAMRLGMWDVFMRDWHDRDTYCLRPAYEMGVPIDRAELQGFHESNQRKLGSVLERIKATTAKGVLKPKAGYAREPKPKTTCDVCAGTGTVTNHADGIAGVECSMCQGVGKIIAPPASILGKPKKGGGEAKLLYMTEGVRLVQAEIEVEVRVCATCHTEDVGPKHRCPRPKQPRVSKRRQRVPADVGSDAAAHGGDAGGPATVRAAAVSASPTGDPLVADVRVERRMRARWFWSLPFNPDAPAQILGYIEQQGYDAPVDKKTQKKTTNKKALENLKKQYADDPLFQLQMDWKAIQKVDATYAVGTLALLDADDRVHPEYLPIPSTLRDSARHPNLTNVVADKSGPQSLAAGFRRCVVARDGVPPGVSAEELAAWEAKWTS